MKKCILPALTLVLATATAHAADLTVGPGQKFATPHDALAAAKPGDTILIHPAATDAGYPQVALLIKTPNLTLRAVPDKPTQLVKLSGKNFNYTGDGPVPRAIIQFDAAAKGCTLEGFDLSGARNKDNNGAGVRINAANDITLNNCDIHDNDMGIMSNGLLPAKTADNQLIENCRIHHNGSDKDPGYNHNLYLGGTAVTVRGCEIFESTTGHNLKSRAHVTRIEGCYIHDAAAREIDLVDEKTNTNTPDSDAFVVGNILVKSDHNESNRTVIHFGQDVKQNRIGTIYIINNTIVSPYISPVLQLSAEKTSAVFANNIIWDKASGQKNQVLVALSNGAQLKNVSGSHNWLSIGFAGASSATLDPATTWFGKKEENPPFANPAKFDFHLPPSAAAFAKRGLPLKDHPVPIKNLDQFIAPASATPRTDAAAPTLGALEITR